MSEAKIKSLDSYIHFGQHKTTVKEKEHLYGLIVNVGDYEKHAEFSLPGRGGTHKSDDLRLDKDTNLPRLKWRIGDPYLVYRATCGRVISGQVCTKTKKKSLRRETCNDRTCALCYPNWAMKAMEKAFSKLAYFQFKNRLYHWSINPAAGQLNTVSDFKKWKKRIYREFKGFGGYIVFHSYRNTDEENHSGKWIVSPHYHLITDCGWLDTKKLHQKFKKAHMECTFVNIENKFTGQVGISRTANDLKAVLAYELGHMNVSEGIVSRSYFGNWANNKVQMKELVIKHNKKCSCEVCLKERWKVDKGNVERWKVEVVEKERILSENSIRLIDHVIFKEYLKLEKVKSIFHVPWAIRPSQLAKFADFVDCRELLDEFNFGVT